MVSEAISKLRKCVEDGGPCIVRPAEACAIIAYIEGINRSLEIGQRTSRARRLAFEAAMRALKEKL